MKRIMTAVMAAAFSVAATTAAQAQGQGQGKLLTSDDLFPWKGVYISAFGGITFLGTENGSATVFGTVGTRNTFDTGFTAGVALGYSWQFAGTPWAIRAEGEYSYTRNSNDKFTNQGFGITANANGRFESNNFMANMYVDYHLRRFVPYIGAGIGLSLTRFSLNVPGGIVDTDGSDVNFAVQAMAGIDYKVLPRLRLGVGYRYQAIFNTDYDVNLTGTNTQVGKQKLGTVDSHMILFKLTYLF